MTFEVSNNTPSLLVPSISLSPIRMWVPGPLIPGTRLFFRFP